MEYWDLESPVPESPVPDPRSETEMCRGIRGTINLPDPKFCDETSDCCPHLDTSSFTKTERSHPPNAPPHSQKQLVFTHELTLRRLVACD
ncbi:hypothetical protein CEXT_425101 [Caerostris extrusa]|uniref:Uncharacterized protein n=1 Tax=Caerostris extrusa TaxID=172846 RepID=A0AAV4RPP1_CAEEX|nr:hypothetical protein CEXT_425101 [Caerostris extrusa]